MGGYWNNALKQATAVRIDRNATAVHPAPGVSDLRHGCFLDLSAVPHAEGRGFHQPTHCLCYLPFDGGIKFACGLHVEGGLCR